MRRLTLSLAIVLMACNWCLPSSAFIAGSAAGENAQPSALMTAIAAAARARADRETDKQMRNWLSETEGYYRNPGAKPLWVSDSGVTEKGLALEVEIGKAYLYGLDNSQFQLPDTNVDSTADLAAAEIGLSAAALKYAWHARGGRVDPSKLSLWLDPSPKPFYASEILTKFESTQDPAAVLRSFHPHNPQFENLRQAYLRERGLSAPAPLQPISPGPRIALGDRHPDVVAIRDRLGYTSKDPAYADVFDRRLLGAVREVMYNANFERKNAIDDDVRREVSKITPGHNGNGNKALIDKMLVNLERWRLMPDDLGQLYVWNNLPEYYTRVIKDGSVIHQEKIVVGTPSTQTPVFSDSMSHVIFQPQWGVPESIKIRQLLPRLKSGDYSVLERRNMHIEGPDGKTLRGRINWSKVNIRDVSIVQGAGSENPLGRLKFIFPNDHDVYMHDTPSKDLFETSVRTHSHGCIRVKNPQQFAEVVLGERQGWTKSDVKAQLAKPATFQVDLSKPIPVHNTYFTVLADSSGKVTSLDDMYGHDRRFLDALHGKSIAAIAAADPALAQLRENKQLEENAASIKVAKARPAAKSKTQLASARTPNIFGFYPKPQPAYLGRKPVSTPKQFIFVWQ